MDEGQCKAIGLSDVSLEMVKEIFEAALDQTRGCSRRIPPVPPSVGPSRLLQKEWHRAASVRGTGAQQRTQFAGRSCDHRDRRARQTRLPPRSCSHGPSNAERHSSPPRRIPTGSRRTLTSPRFPKTPCGKSAKEFSHASGLMPLWRQAFPGSFREESERPRAGKFVPIRGKARSDHVLRYRYCRDAIADWTSGLPLCATPATRKQFARFWFDARRSCCRIGKLALTETNPCLDSRRRCVVSRPTQRLKREELSESLIPSDRFPRHWDLSPPPGLFPDNIGSDCPADFAGDAIVHAALALVDSYVSVHSADVGSALDASIEAIARLFGERDGDDDSDVDHHSNAEEIRSAEAARKCPRG